MEMLVPFIPWIIIVLLTVGFILLLMAYYRQRKRAESCSQGDLLYSVTRHATADHLFNIYTEYRKLKDPDWASFFHRATEKMNENIRLAERSKKEDVVTLSYNSVISMILQEFKK